LDDVKAFQEGGVGWAAGRGHFEMGGKRVPVRFTAVLRQEDGEWKAVQAHASIGVPNDRMLDAMFQPGLSAGTHFFANGRALRFTARAITNAHPSRRTRACGSSSLRWSRAREYGNASDRAGRLGWWPT